LFIIKYHLDARVVIEALHILQDLLVLVPVVVHPVPPRPRPRPPPDFKFKTYMQF